MTNLPLDDQGRYGQQIVIDGKTYAPKFFPCATPECLGNNLDMSDPQTVDYAKALNKKIFDDIGTGATYTVIAVPAGSIGAAAGALGVLASIASGIVNGTPGTALSKEALAAAATTFLKGVYGLSEIAANRVTALVDLAGGWQAFIDRSKEQVNDLLGTK